MIHFHRYYRHLTLRALRIARIELRQEKIKHEAQELRRLLGKGAK